MSNATTKSHHTTVNTTLKDGIKNAIRWESLLNALLYKRLHHYSLYLFLAKKYNSHEQCMGVSMLDKFKESLLTDEIRDVYQRYLLGHDIWYFRVHKNAPNPASEYDELKLYISKKLDLHVNNIAIVGSAKMGFSLSPSKKYKPFDESSDIDIVIVSDKVFHSSWSAYRELHQKGYLSGYTNIAKDIFRGFVSLKNVDSRSEFFDTWSRKVDPLKRDFQTLFDIPHEVNYRVYDSWESVEDYHKSGLVILKNQIERAMKEEKKTQESSK